MEVDNSLHFLFPEFLSKLPDEIFLGIVSIFQFTGRVGSAVGSKGKGGKVVLRQYQPSVANPRTPAQMSQRAKMKLAAQVAGMLGEVGQTGGGGDGDDETETE